MHWNDWMVICWTISTLFELRKRHWTSAAWSACFAAFAIVDRFPPPVFASPLKYSFLAIGALLIAFEIATTYRRYKKGLAVTR
jgi:hypothetical protein